jgi:hypothetical protein
MTLLVASALHGQTNCTPPPPGLVSWWRAEGNALDWTGGNNGTIQGGVSFGPGEVGEAFILNGLQSGVLLGSPSNLELENFTIETWIKRATNSVTTLDTEFAPGGYMFGFFQGGNGYGFGIDNDGTVFLAQSGSVFASAGGVYDSSFHHVAVTVSDTNITFFIDGSNYSSMSYNPNVAGYQGDAVLGCADENLTATFFGSIDELSIYNQALSASEIQAIYNAGSAGKCTNSTAAPAILSQPSNQTIIIGDQVTFAVSATSFGPEGYQWSLDGTNIDGATNSALALSNVQFNQAGSYAVTITNAFGPTTSSNAVLTVLPTPPCVTAPSGLISWWRAEDNTIDRVGGNNGTLEGGAGYTVGKVGQGFSIAGDASAVTIGDATNLQFQNFTIECWVRRANASLATEDGSGVGALFAFGSGGYGFGLYDSGQLGLGAVDGIDIESSIAVADTNFHHVAVTKSGTNVTFYLDGIGYPTGGLDVAFTFTTSPAIGAIGDTLQNSFYGTIDEMSIYNQALSGADIAAIYGARAAGKCVPPVPIIAAQPASQTVTAYSPASFSILADGPVPLLYQWAFDGTNLTGATNSTLSFDAALPSEAGTYSVIVGTAPNTTNSSNAVLTVILPPAPTILTQPASHIGVAEDYTTFTVVAQSQEPVPMSYQWSFEGTNLASATNSELVISNLTLANAGAYTVQVSNPFFASNSQPAVLTMIPAPTGTNRIVANLDPNELTRAVLGGGSVTFVCSGTITLSQPIAVGRDVVVEGSNTIVLSGGGRSQLLTIQSGVNVTLRGLSISSGLAINGGAISNAGTMTVEAVNSWGNDAAWMGGAIFNAGTAILTSVILSSNETFEDWIYAIPGRPPYPGNGEALGGAIYNIGTLSLTNVIFSGNEAEGSGTSSAYGGGLFNSGGTINLSNVLFDGNLAEGGTDYDFPTQGWGFGGALYSNDGWLTGSGIECTNNAALGGDGSESESGFGVGGSHGSGGAGEGGAIYFTNGMANLSNGWFEGNYTDCSTVYNYPPVSSQGGALFNWGWTELTAIGFQGNYCLGAGGAPGSALGNVPDLGIGGGPGEGGIGGAVCNMGLLTMTNCTLTGNDVTASNGGLGSYCGECNPPYTGANGAPGNALGGALANFGTLDIFSNAFLNNSATGPGTNVGTIYNVGNMGIDASTTISPDTVDSNPGAFAPRLVVEPQSEVVAAGSTVTLTALAVGSPDPTYQWSWDRTNLGSATAPTLILTNIQLSQSGTYWVEATNSVGSETSAPVVLTVLAAPVTLTGSSLGAAGFSISGTGVPGVNFVIEVSTNLIEWQPLQTNPSPFTFIDTNTSTFSSRYYRAAVAQ